MRRFILLTIGILYSILSFSQKDSLSVVDFTEMSLEELMNMEVTTASKFAQKATEAPATVYIVTNEQIEARNYSCLTELLEDIPQIEIQRKSHSESSQIVTLNGVFGNEKFLILMDGIRVNSTTGNVHSIGESYSLANIKQVEIILGPASALYGADAFTGIINIKTYKGYENKGIHVNTSYGLYNTTNNSVVFGAGNEDVSFTFTGKYYHSDEPFFPDYYSEYSWYNHYKETGEMMLFGNAVKPERAIEQWAIPTNSYSAHAKLNIKNFEVGYSRFYESHNNSVASSPENYIFSKKTKWTNHIQNIYLKHSFNSLNEKFGLNTTISAHHFKVYPSSLYINQFSAYANAYKYARDKTLKIEEQFNYNFSEKVNLVGGLSFEYFNAIPKTCDLPYEYDESKAVDEQDVYYPGSNVNNQSGNDLTILQDVYELKYNNIGSYIQLQAEIIKNISLTAGTRFDHNSRYGSTFNPRAGLVIKSIKKLNIKLLYGEAFLAPSPIKAYQHYGSFYPETDVDGEITGLASSYWFLTSPDLEPEKRKSFDANIIYSITPDFAFSLTTYYSKMTNLIQTAGFTGETFKGIPVDYVERNINAGKAEAYGGSLRLDYMKPLSGNLTAGFFASYSFSDGNIAGNPLLFSAKNTFKAGVNISSKSKFNIYTQFIYRSGSHAYSSTADNQLLSDAFSLVNITGNYLMVNAENVKIQLFVDSFNLLNSKYYNAGNNGFDFTPQDPIRVDFGLKISF